MEFHILLVPIRNLNSNTTIKQESRAIKQEAALVNQENDPDPVLDPNPKSHLDPTWAPTTLAPAQYALCKRAAAPSVTAYRKTTLGKLQHTA